MNLQHRRKKQAISLGLGCHYYLVQSFTENTGPYDSEMYGAATNSRNPGSQLNLDFITVKKRRK